jgi:hypothetical protein
MVKMPRANHQGAALVKPANSTNGQCHTAWIPPLMSAVRVKAGEPRQLGHEQAAPADLLAQGEHDADEEAGRNRHQRLGRPEDVAPEPAKTDQPDKPVDE